MQDLFETLSDRTRLRILNLLAQGELCVCYFTAILRSPQPTISRHLAHLREAGLVAARRDGKWIHYSLVSPAEETRARVLGVVLEEIARDPEMEKDTRALQRACCAPRLPAALAGAPRPSLRSSKTSS
jgi:ArsR family transcriptional regulator